MSDLPRPDLPVNAWYPDHYIDIEGYVRVFIKRNNEHSKTHEFGIRGGIDFGHKRSSARLAKEMRRAQRECDRRNRAAKSYTELMQLKKHLGSDITFGDVNA